MSVTISCIIPVYNAADYLGEALDSALAQSRKLDEIIVVDDGSTDASADVVACYAPHVQYVRQDNMGPAGARNHGLRLARGDFITFLDADDVWKPEKTAVQLAAFFARPQLEMCTVHVQNFWIAELAHEALRLEGQRPTQPQPGYVLQSLMARRGLFDRVGVLDEHLRVSEDTDWFQRAERAGIVMEILPDVLVRRRIHHNNTSYRLFNSQAARDNILEVTLKNLRARRAKLANGDVHR